MFGIKDPLILLPYLLGALCLIFSAWYGLKFWNREDRHDKEERR